MARLEYLQNWVNNNKDQWDTDLGKEMLRKLEEEEENTENLLLQEREDNRAGLAKTGAAFLGDIAIGEATRFGGAAAGAAIGSAVPVIGTAVGAGIGYLIGGLGGGAVGSITRQKMLNPDGEVDRGQLFADSLINLIPAVGKAGKIMSKAGAQAGLGAGTSVSAVALERLVNEGELPTIEELGAAGLTGAVLGGGLGVTGELFENSYRKFAGLPSRNFSMAWKAGDPDAKIIVDGIERNAKEYSDEVAKRYQEFGINLREKYDDEFIRVRLLQDISAGGQMKMKDGKLQVTGDEMDYYMQRRLAEGKVDARLSQLQEEVDLDAAALLQKGEEMNLSPTELSAKINEYMYAKHAIDYNRLKKGTYKADGAAGIGTKQAKAIVKNFEDAGLNKSLGIIVEGRQKISREILDVLEDGQLVSKDLANQLRKERPNYIPLKRIMDEDADNDALKFFTNDNSVRYEAGGTGLQRAKGSAREVDVTEISQNVVTNLAQAVRRAENNKANLAFARLIQANTGVQRGKGKRTTLAGTQDGKPTEFKYTPSPLEPKGTGKGADIAEIVPQKIKTVNGKPVFQKVLDDSEEGLRMAKLTGKPVMKEVPVMQDVPMGAISFYDNGKLKYIKFKEEYADVAKAMKGVDQRQIDPLMKGMLAANRFMGGMYTRYNPEFLIPNLIRDRTEAFVNFMAKTTGRKAAGLLDPRGIYRDVNVIRRNVFGQKGVSAAEIEEDRLYREFKEAGASTGGLAVTTMKDISKNIEKLSKKLTTPSVEKTKALNKYVDGVNQMFEDSSRFGTYKKAREAGMSKDQAAFAARNSSFDPKQRGSSSDTIRAAYLFVNPAIQGGKNFLRSMKDPATAAKVMGGLTATTFAIDRMNSSIDEDWREKVPQWKMDKQLVFVTGKKEDGSLNYVSVPVGYSMVPFKQVADFTQKFASGNVEMNNVKEVGERLSKSIIDAYNPMGGSPIPTQLRPIVDLLSNSDGLGRDIRPDWLERQNIDPRERVFPWTADTLGGEMAMNFADQLGDMGMPVSPENLRYLYNTYVGGPGKFTERLFDMTAKMYNGEKLKPNDIPLMRRFYGETFNSTFEARTGREQTIENLDREANTNSAKASRIAYNIMRKYRNAKEGEDQMAILRGEMEGNPDVTESVRRRVKKMLKDEVMGITYMERKARGLPVRERASYLIQEIQNLGNDEKKVEKFVSEMRRKKILTSSVMRIMFEMQKMQRQ